jgi:hypothetical protein
MINLTNYVIIVMYKNSYVLYNIAWQEATLDQGSENILRKPWTPEKTYVLYHLEIYKRIKQRINVDYLYITMMTSISCT